MLECFERLALDAGRLVMDVFNSCMTVEHKTDCSPVTEADRASEKLILAGLRSEFPAIACVAEEEASMGILPPSLGREFFLIDPLDGTREFVQRHLDFTVNIALVRDGDPIAGIVYAPACGKLFLGRPGHAEAGRVDEQGHVIERRRIRARQGSAPMTIVASRSHINDETRTYLRRFDTAEIVSVGSSIKFCLIAEGEADIYPRLSRTMEWDTAAGDAILRAAGGTTVTQDGKPLKYGKAATGFANPSFISCGRHVQAQLN
ncbi:MAG: 3'(2'),5'-bisphosphate nucleotidase CysQ [Rhizobiaceae bacterium]